MQVIYPVSLSFTMISVSLYYQRTIPYRKINSVSYTMIACSCAYAACSTFYELLICRPLSSYWTMSEVCSKHSHAPYVVFGVFSVVMMTTLLALPFPWLGRARLGIMDRIGSGCILAVGLWYVISNIIHLEASPNAPQHNCLKLSPDQNPFNRLSKRARQIEYGVSGMELHGACPCGANFLCSVLASRISKKRHKQNAWYRTTALFPRISPSSGDRDERATPGKSDPAHWHRSWSERRIPLHTSN